uniref:NADH-ubiquinone oxidoreductase chain 2 n=1 Tax=Spongiocaris panglao TaxID=1986577 RepID=A0A345F0N2_9EUCA|nr:NADH dehydrogenase subunit 2 [Spongiocaris panglao]AXG21507.1 NADH dehydrogenase subunit 2 [Spongiocaris panglao]
MTQNMLYPSSILFSSTLSMGIILAISSSSWFGAWMGLELNLMSFLALISIKNNQYSSESALKYFLIQTLASLVIMFSALVINTLFEWASMGIMISLFLKSGVAPFHFWFPIVMESLNWSHTTILLTLQKIAPLSLLSHLAKTNEFLFMIFIFISASVGAIGGLNQTSLRKLLAYSSISHMAWMLTAILISEMMWMIYLFTYCLMILTITFLFFYQQSFYLSSLITNKTFSMTMKMVTFMALLSLGGLPPFTGFFIKWMMIQELVITSNFFILLILLISALLTLFFYMRIIFFVLLIYPTTPKWMITKSKMTLILPLISMLHILGIWGPSFFILLA